jgi:hypothetical protein
MRESLPVVAVVVLLAGMAAAEGWVSETIDSSGKTGLYTSIALDNSGNPHISYFDWTDFVLRYAHWNGYSWEMETVDEGYDEAGRYSSLQLDSSGNPHISYMKDNDQLMYASRNGSAWEIEVVDSDCGWGRHTSLELDASEGPHISYVAEYDNLMYAHWNGSAWETETVDEDSVGTFNSIALDASGDPHISYWGNTDLKYVAWSFPAWEIQTVDEEGYVGYWTSLELDSAGHPHISYEDYTNSALKYAHWNGSAWETETVDEEGEVGRYTSLALDSQEYPHISYFDDTGNDLRYARWNGAEWEIQTVDSQGDQGLYTSIALDSCGNPFISYGDDGNDNLKYAWWNGAPPAFSLLSPADGETVCEWPLADWEDAPDYPCVSYDLWYSTQPDFVPHDEVNDLTASEYQLSDSELDPCTTYYWKVRASDGYEETWSEETWSFTTDSSLAIDDPDAGDVLALHPPRPNPAGPCLGVAFTLPRSRPVALSLYDVSGRLVATLLDRSLRTAGTHEVSCDCSALPEGVYMVHLETDARVLTRRIVVTD